MIYFLKVTSKPTHLSLSPSTSSLLPFRNNKPTFPYLIICFPSPELCHIVLPIKNSIFFTMIFLLHLRFHKWRNLGFVLCFKWPSIPPLDELTEMHHLSLHINIENVNFDSDDAIKELRC